MRNLRNGALLVVALAAAGAAGAQEPASDADTLPAPNDSAVAAVLAKLDDSDRATLERWMARYASPTGRHGARHGWTGAARIPDSYYVDEVVDRGSYIRLEDGTLWEIALGDRPATATWQPNESIVVRTIGAPTGDYEYELVNADNRLKAAARFAGRGATQEGLVGLEDVPEDEPNEQ
jgi:hypothetical protein